jgi:hypothetical protein
MPRITEDDAFNLISAGTKYIKLQIELDSFNKLQLNMTNRITQGVELFGIGPIELIRGANFLVDYQQIINYAINKKYRVFVLKESTDLNSEKWYLEFKNNE